MGFCPEGYKIIFLVKFFGFAKNTFPFMKRVENVYPLFYFLRGVEFMSKNSKLESNFQKELKKELKDIFKGCIVTKLDPNDIQGIPDLLILYKKQWATLECKKSAGAKKRPNQTYYVDRMNQMSFSRFICPENKEEVLDELQQAFKTRRRSRVSRSK